MNNDATNVNEQIPPYLENEEKHHIEHNSSPANQKENQDENFSIFDHNLDDEEKENVMSQENRNDTGITNHNHHAEENLSNNSNQIDPQILTMHNNMINFLKMVQENSYLNDENSQKFFEENTPNTIQFFLTTK